MPNAKVTAPPNPETVRRQRASALASKGTGRTPAETNELIGILLARIADLENA